MYRKTLIAVAIAALLAAGVASAAVVARKITLRPGHCATVAKIRVCAARAPRKTIHRVTTVIDHETQIVTQATTQTVTQPAVTVTAPAVTVTVPEVIGVPSPPPVTTPTGGGSPVALDFSGSGSLALRPFSLPIGETLSWTVTQDTFGSYGNFILDCGYANSWIGINALDAPNGSSYIPSGSYNSCSVIAENSWTIHIG